MLEWGARVLCVERLAGPQELMELGISHQELGAAGSQFTLSLSYFQPGSLQPVRVFFSPDYFQPELLSAPAVALCCCPSVATSICKMARVMPKLASVFCALQFIEVQPWGGFQGDS